MSDEEVLSVYPEGIASLRMFFVKNMSWRHFIFEIIVS